MKADAWLPVLSIALWVAFPVVVFLGRNWLLAWISKGVQHRFDVKLEELRAELRKNEERVKSDLRDKEDEISTLRKSVLSGSAGRQALLDKRRFEAVEKVWTNVNELARLKGFSGMMALMNYKAVTKLAHDPRMQQVLTLIGSGAPDVENLPNVAKNERPFLPELAWAYFTAYSTILYGIYVRFMILKTGLDDPEQFLSKEGAQKILKAALPHHSKFIDENEPEAYYYLVEELENLLLIELRKVLEGEEADQAAAERAKQITDAIKSAEKERAEKTAAKAG